MASATSAKEIEGHEIQGVISTTSRSTVYKAFQKEKNREVVLKTLSSRDGAVINRFVERAKGSSKLSHPNVARLFLAGADQSTGTPFVTMEFIQAPNLESIIRQKGRVPVNVGTKLLGQALLALSAAEKNGIRHTDLNPSHCISAGGDLKLIGFVCSGIEDDEEEVLPFYSSPEEAGGGQTDVRSDIYSLGATFYHAMCGAPPFLADNPIQLKMNILEQEVVAPSDMETSVPEALSNFMTILLAKDPAARFQTFEEAVEAFKGLQGLDAAPAAPATIPQISAPPAIPQISAPPADLDFGLADPFAADPGESAAPSPQVAAPPTQSDPGLFDTLALSPDMAPAEAAPAPASPSGAPPASASPSSGAPPSPASPSGAPPAPASGAPPVPAAGLSLQQPAAAAAPAEPAVVDAVPVAELGAAGKGGFTMDKARTAYIVIMWSVIAVALVGGGGYLYMDMNKGSGGRSYASGGPQCVELLQQAEAFAAANPGKALEQATRFRKVVDACPGTLEAKTASRHIRAVEAELVEVAAGELNKITGRALQLTSEKEFVQAYEMVAEFRNKYLVLTGIVADCQALQGDIAEQAMKAIREGLKKMEQYDPKSDRELIVEGVVDLKKMVIPPVEEEADTLIKDYETFFLSVAEVSTKHVEEAANKLYISYRENMQFSAKLADWPSALKEVQGYRKKLEDYSRKANSDKEKRIWSKYQKWAEVDEISLKIVRERWDGAAKEWVTKNRGKQVKVGTSQGRVSRLEDGRIFIHQGKDILTEPSGMLPADLMMDIAFPKMDFQVGEIELERGWWLLYRESHIEAQKALASAKNLKAETKDYEQALERYVFSGWDLDPLFTGNGAADSDGTVKLNYDFQSRDQATDWFAMEGEHQIIRRALYPLSAGDNGSYIQGQLPMTGAITIAADVTFQAERSKVRFGFVRAKDGRASEYHYFEISPRTFAYWIGVHLKQKSGTDEPKSIEPLAVKRKHRVRLEWLKGVATLFVNERKLPSYRYPNTGSWLPMLGNRGDHNVTPPEGVVIDNVLIVGKPTRDWVKQQKPALWLAAEKRSEEGWIKLYNGINMQGWNEYGQGTWTPTDFKGILEANGTPNATADAGELNWRNCIVSAKVRIKPGASIRLYLRRNPGKDGGKSASQYVLTCGEWLDCGVYANEQYEYFSGRKIKGSWHTHWHDMTVSAKGTYFNIFINNRLYYQVQDSTLQSGKIGLYSNRKSSWRDIRIKLLDSGG